MHWSLSIATLVFLCNNLFASADLTFSKDSIIAYDGRPWRWDSNIEDSIEIKNVSTKKLIIDSIKIDLPENEYPQFQIGWIVHFTNKDSQSVQVFNSGNKLAEGCFHKGIALTEYKKLPEKDKLSIEPKSRIKIQSPDVSINCCATGLILEIPGPPRIDTINRAYTGKISFFSNNIEYSIFLNITLYKWPTSVINQNKKEIKQAVLKSPQKTITLLGRSYDSRGKLQMHRMLQSKTQNSTVYIVK